MVGQVLTRAPRIMNALLLLPFLTFSFACRLLFVRYDRHGNVWVCLRTGENGQLQIPTLAKACSVGLATEKFKGMTRGKTRELSLAPDAVVLLDSEYFLVPVGSGLDKSIIPDSRHGNFFWVSREAFFLPALSSTARNLLERFRETDVESIPFYGPMERTVFEQMISVPVIKGLPNLTATCYLNATLQALFHIPIFREQIKSLKNPDQKSVSHILSKLFNDMETIATQKVIPESDMRALIDALGRFSNGNDLNVQYDPQEVLEFIGKALTVENFSAHWMGSVFTQMIVVEQVDHYTCACNEVNKVTRHPAYSYQLLPLETDRIEIRLEDLIDRSLEKNPVDGVNGHRGSGHDYQRQTRVKSLPPILIFNVNRNRIVNGLSIKNEIPVNIPISGLNMTRLVDGYEGDPLIYDLVAVIGHTGEIRPGHYTCMFKHGRWWYELSDNAWGKNHDLNEKEDFNSPNGVLFFYQLRSTIGEIVPVEQPENFMGTNEVATEAQKSGFKNEEEYLHFLSSLTQDPDSHASSS